VQRISHGPLIVPETIAEKSRSFDLRVEGRLESATSVVGFQVWRTRSTSGDREPDSNDTVNRIDRGESIVERFREKPQKLFEIERQTSGNGSACNEVDRDGGVPRWLSVTLPFDRSG